MTISFVSHGYRNVVWFFTQCCWVVNGCIELSRIVDMRIVHSLAVIVGSLLGTQYLQGSYHPHMLLRLLFHTLGGWRCWRAQVPGLILELYRGCQNVWWSGYHWCQHRIFFHLASHLVVSRRHCYIAYGKIETRRAKALKKFASSFFNIYLWVLKKLWPKTSKSWSKKMYKSGLRGIRFSAGYIPHNSFWNGSHAMVLCSSRAIYPGFYQC